MCVGIASAARSEIHDRKAFTTVAGPPSIDPHAESELCTKSKSALKRAAAFQRLQNLRFVKADQFSSGSFVSSKNSFCYSLADIVSDHM